MKRVVLRTAARLSPRGRRLGLTDTNNGLRVFNKTVADGLDITMSGMSHATEFIMLIAENRWRVAEEPVEPEDHVSPPHLPLTCRRQARMGCKAADREQPGINGPRAIRENQFPSTRMHSIGANQKRAFGVSPILEFHGEP